MSATASLRAAFGYKWRAHHLIAGALLRGSVFFALFVALFGSLGLLQDWRVWSWDFWTQPRVSDNVVSAILVAWLPMIPQLGARDACAFLRKLASEGSIPASRLPALLEETTGWSWAKWRQGVPVVVLFTVLLAAQGSSDDASASHPLLVAWRVGRLGLLTTLGYLALRFDLDAARSYYRIGRDQIAIDLLDSAPLVSFARHALRPASRWIVTSSVVSLFSLSERTGISDLGALIGVLAAAAMLVVVPLAGLRSRVRRKRQAELERVRGAIARQAASSGATVDDLARGVGSLLVYRSQIENTRIWVFDGSQFLRLVFYLSLAVASWLGGAVMERGLGLILDP